MLVAACHCVSETPSTEDELMKLYFMRHGESEANTLRVISNRGFQHPLTDRGREQAHTLAQKLNDAGIRRIYASPLMRAVQTAEILAAAWGVEMGVHAALREYDCGIIEGRSDEQAWQIWLSTWQNWLEAGACDYRIEGGESFNDIRMRFVPFVNTLIEQRGGEDVSLALIGHGGIYHYMLPLVLENIDTDFARENPIGNTDYIVAQNDGQHLLCVEWCGKTVSAL
jgi:broad specificity phosphatase PhoE